MKTRLTMCALLLTALLGVPVGASAQAPPAKAAAAFDGAGTYDLEFQTSEGGMASVLVLNRKEGRLAGTLELHGEMLQIDGAVLKNKVLNFIAKGPHGEIKLDLTFKSDDHFEGAFASPMGEGTIKGTRRKK